MTMGRKREKLHRQYDGRTGRVVAQGSLVFDERQGPWVHWYPSGECRARGVYCDDLEAGRWSFWYKNGERAAQGDLVDGMEDGTWTYWHETGEVMCQGTYSCGDQVGRWTHRTLDGTISRVEVWEHGLLVRCLQLVGDHDHD